MKQLFKDFLGFIKCLSQVDILLYVAILCLIILIVSLIYIVKTSEEVEEDGSCMFNNDDVDLKDIVTNIENTDSTAINITSYEEEQEEKAIISYDELIKRGKNDQISYENEEILNNEVSVRKINLDKKTKTETEPIKVFNNNFFNYEKEEEFLKSLQALNKLLN